MSDLNVVAATPLIIAGGTATVAFGVGHPARAHHRAATAPRSSGMAGIVAAIVMSVVLWGDRQEAFDGGLRADRFSLLLNVVFLSAAAAHDPAGVARARRGGPARRVRRASILISATGMMLVAGAGDLIAIFLGIEILSVALYVLCALEVWRERVARERPQVPDHRRRRGVRSCSTAWRCCSAPPAPPRLAEIGRHAPGTSFTGEPLVVAAMVADRLRPGASRPRPRPSTCGRPTSTRAPPRTVTAFMATATKAAAFAAFLRIFAGRHARPADRLDRSPSRSSPWLSIVVGNIAALVQNNMKRLLAYSSIAQAGYLLIGVAAGTIARRRGGPLLPARLRGR